MYVHIGLHIVSGGGANGKLLRYGIGGANRRADPGLALVF